MLCVTDNWIVPGANPCAGGGSGSVTVVNAGTGITVTGTPTAPIINNAFQVVSGHDIFITGTSIAPIINSVPQVLLVGTGATVQLNLLNLAITPILTLNFYTGSSGFIIMNGNATCRTITNNQNDITYYCEIDGNMVQAGVNYETIQGNNHYVTLSMTAYEPLPAGNHTAIFYVITTATTNDIFVLSRHLNGTITLTDVTSIRITPPDQSSTVITPLQTFTYNLVSIPSNYIWGQTVTFSCIADITYTVPLNFIDVGRLLVSFTTGNSAPPIPENFGRYNLNSGNGTVFSFPITLTASTTNIAFNTINIQVYNLRSLQGNLTCNLRNIQITFPVIN